MGLTSTDNTDKLKNEIYLLNISIFFVSTFPIFNKNYLSAQFLSHEFSQARTFTVHKQGKERNRGKEKRYLHHSFQNTIK